MCKTIQLADVSMFIIIIMFVWRGDQGLIRVLGTHKCSSDEERRGSYSRTGLHTGFFHTSTVISDLLITNLCVSSSERYELRC
jgi:hypothetical protein